MASTFRRIENCTKRILNVSKCANIQKNVISTRYISASAFKMASRTPVGFIGLGNMGGFMAKNLLKHGYPLVAFDVYPESLIEIQELGASVANSPAEVVEKVDKVVTMLPSSPNVLEVYLGNAGILKNVNPGTLLIDSSTIDPAVSKQVAAAAEKQGAMMLDAPVSGGVNAAREGTLTFMVGGKEEEFKAAKELLDCMGKNVVNTGPVGTGQAAKICNNMMLAISMIGCSETMNLGMRLGLDPKMLASILNTSSGRSWSSEVYNPVPGVLENVPSSNNYQGGFGTALMTKDLSLAQTAATATSTATPLGSIAHQLYRVMCNRGLGNKDFSVAYQFLKEETEV
ncbi:3-hydroxyisobutyrate dehydrogenase, mitochondrial-like [Anneissia japonica]|uniref:3-hydroxyisobutyrate dehydrogenase, mitochondrial-like n=1 Tax=Anneissia japonica TaxID=1529436 RepID=UPI0014258F78|nr:3-hydroxyisobutyrate dehydrogenase, mitochondrial-like [Anneissia japonica]